MFSRRPGMSTPLPSAAMNAESDVQAIAPQGRSDRGQSNGGHPVRGNRVRKLTAVSLAVASVVQPGALVALAGTPGSAASAPRGGLRDIQTPTPLLGISTVLSSNLSTTETDAVENDLLAADNETLRQASDQYKAKDYEEAAATLASIKADDLSAGDREAYKQLQDRIGKAVDARKTARADYERGEALLSQGKLADALQAYRSAADSRYADQATRTKALEQIALAETQQKSAEVADRASYQEARELLAKGDLDGAKTRFQALADKGFKVGLFQRSPQDYLQEIASKQGTPAQAAAPAAAPSTPAAPAAPSASDLYHKGVDQYRAGDLAGAKASFDAARAAGYRPGLFERSPEEYIKRIEDTMAKAAPAAPATPAPTAVAAAPSAAVTVEPAAGGSAPAPVAPAPAPVTPAPAAPAPEAAAPATPAPAAPAPAPANTPPVQQGPAVTVTPADGSAPSAPAATNEPAPVPAADKTEQARQFYDAGVSQFDKGNLDDAQKNFQAAKDAAGGSYKPGFFSDTVDRWLTRVDTRRTELANDRLAAEQRAIDAANEKNRDARSAEARKYYTTAREQYRGGNWIEARKNFVASIDAGYRPGLFEDSPQKYLERMDKKEAADAAKAANAMGIAAAPAPAPDASVNVAPAAAPTTMPAAAPAPVAASPAPAAPAVDGPAHAQELVAQARAAQAGGDNAKALDLYTQATIADPNNQAAVAGRNELAAAKAAPAPGGGTLLDQQQQLIQGRRQVIQYSFDQSIGQARERTAQGDFAGARQAIEQARAARNTDPTIFTVAEIATFDTDIATAQTNLDQAVVTRKAADERQATDQALRTEVEAKNRALSERQRTVATLISQSRGLTEQSKYVEALNVIDQILALDPSNDYAQGVRPLIEDRAQIQQQRRISQEYRRQMDKQFTRAEEIQVPYDDLMRYPDNWPDISEMRDAQNALDKGQTNVDAAAIATLDKRLPEIRFENVAFGDVVDALREMTGANIFVDWKTLEGAGIDRTTPVNVSRLVNVRFEKALQTVLAFLGGNGTPLDYSIDEGVITISTKEKISSAVSLVVYDVSDLLFRPLDAGQPPNLDFTLTPVTKGGGGNAGGNLFGGGNTGGNQQQDRPPEQILDALVQLLEQLVAPEQWASAGGTGNIRPFQTGSSYSLLVTANRNTHRELDRLLNKLRASQAVQVSVEARFLTVNRSFLEDIGIDIDVDLNRNGSLGSKFGSRTGTNGAFTNTIPIRQNSVNFTANPRTGLPSALSTLTTDTNPAFSVAGTFLDDFSVDFLIRATQASVNSTVAQAPRLLLFSGQRAQVKVQRTQFFVTDLTPIVGTGAVAFQPNPSGVSSGVDLWVQAVVSADRKYVQLNLVPRLTQLIDVQNFTFQTAATTTDTNASSGGVSTVPGVVTPVAGIATATIQLPNVSQTGVFTSASVPDGGTVLLGGLTQGGAVENEAGVPVLSKIPFIKRLFTNRSNAKDESVVLILVRPTIVIQREIEARSFPLLSGKTTP